MVLHDSLLICTISVSNNSLLNGIIKSLRCIFWIKFDFDSIFAYLSILQEISVLT